MSMREGGGGRKEGGGRGREIGNLGSWRIGEGRGGGGSARTRVNEGKKIENIRIVMTGVKT
jgi:hypothetical protein